ncbi:hypothetical protein EC912_10178 [Luteibacter rhizovicinus]|uniref:Uncharacterized protein n=1 Tax=Luteibacter rhizovicinus TaxID=242606 RepID=A0A4R3Z083_9GAMM|nr:hypothetical protein [Luteibacter rhizovicinus]TCV97083.1 hypothetical protein EC912_10178 [Luteibacter rhizovicinus]
MIDVVEASARDGWWRLPVWIDRSGRVFRWLLVVATLVGGGTLCFFALGIPALGPFGATVLLAIVWQLSRVIYLAGTYMAARRAGMVVTFVRAGSVDLLPQKGFWKIRWKRYAKRIPAVVNAVYDPARPVAPQMIRQILGGPLTLLTAALVCAVLASIFLPGRAGFLFCAMAVVNGGIGVISLLPVAGAVESAGTAAYRWRWKTPDISAPRFVYARFLAHSVFGRATDEWSLADLDLLSRQPMPMPFIALWCRLKSLQHAGQWADAAHRVDELSALLDTEDAKNAWWSDLVAQLVAEIAFSTAMATGDASGLTDDLLTRGAGWSFPALWPRCLALRAALIGDVEQCRHWLDVARRRAEVSVSRSMPESEAILARSVLSVLKLKSTEES